MKTRSSFPSAPQAALLLLASFLLQYLVGAAMYDARHALGLTYEQVTTIGVLLSNGFLVAVVTHLLGLNYRDLLHPSKSSPIAAFLLLVPPVLLLLPLVVLLDVALVESLEIFFPVSSWEQAAFASMLEPTLPAVIATCVLAPLFEEILFRGILLRAFLDRYPRGLAISYSALYFGAAHLNIYQFFLAFLLGLLLGWLYERSRSLIPCIALHAAVNSAVMALGAKTDLNPGLTLASTSPLTWALSIAAGAAGALVLHYILVNRRRSSTDAA